MEKGKKISRKEAIKKVGVSALATSTLVFLETKAASACSGTKPGEIPMPPPPLPPPPPQQPRPPKP